jgi:tRNA uridine 5-carbamoylmethylation protein Kti12
MDLTPFHKLDIVLVCGLPKAGKSHFSRRYFQGTERRRINRREIRKSLYEMTHFGEKWLPEFFNEDEEALVKHTESRLLEHLLNQNTQILVDNISVTAGSRVRYIDLSTRYRKTIGCIFLDTPVRVCLNRNSRADTPLMETVITNLYAKKEIPTESEGFDRTLIIDNYWLDRENK